MATDIRWRKGNGELGACSEEDLRNFYYTYWTGFGKLPGIMEVAKALGTNPAFVQNIIQGREFREVLIRRGLPMSEKFILDAVQFRTIAILTDPTIKGGLPQRLKVAGVSYNTFKAWMRIPQFKEALNQGAEAILENNLAGVNIGLVTAAERGDIPAVKFFYEITGRYDPTEKKVMDVMAVLSGVVEILSAEITDVDVLGRIAGKLQMLAVSSGAMPKQAPLIQAPQEPIIYDSGPGEIYSPAAETSAPAHFEITPLGELP